MAKETKKPQQTAQAAAPEQKAAEHDWSTESVSGFEAVRPEDLGLPFLIIVQKGSPEVDNTHKDYATKKIEGAEVGDIVNTLSREVVYSKGSEALRVIPCSYERLFQEWSPREKGGGMVKSHKNQAILSEVAGKNDKGQDVLRNGNVLVTTAYFAVRVIPDEGDSYRAVIGLSSTQLKKGRQWLNMSSSLKLTNGRGERFTPPMFSHEYHLTTGPESNAKGSWYGWKIELGPMLKDPKLISDARETAKSAVSSERLLAAPSDTTEVM